MAGGVQARRVFVPELQAGCTPPAGLPVLQLQGLTMGTSWSLRVVDRPASCSTEARLHAGVQALLDDLVAQMSHWEAASDLGRYNRLPAGTWAALRPDFLQVLDVALQVARASGGAYDPGAGALVNLWGFGPRSDWQAGAEQAWPGADAIEDCLRQRRAQPLQLDLPGRRVLQPGGLQLDLSSIAKGHAVDAVSAWLRASGHPHHLVEIGGELRGEGLKPDGQPWWVELETQVETHEAAPASPPLLALHGLSVATSGDYRRWLQHGGQRYGHTLDPRTGRPASTTLAAVSVVHAECSRADAWSTALTVLGVEAGLALADRLGLAARFVCRGDGGAGPVEHLSRALRRLLD